jgi:hypothetical protein
MCYRSGSIQKPDFLDKLVAPWENPVSFPPVPWMSKLSLIIGELGEKEKKLKVLIADIKLS